MGDHDRKLSWVPAGGSDNGRAIGNIWTGHRAGNQVHDRGEARDGAWRRPCRRSGRRFGGHRELASSIDYRVPPPLISAIAEFDGSIIVDRTRGEGSARCDSEAANVLVLNMVHELVSGKRDVDSARHASEQNTVAHTIGPEAPYAERLLFEVPDDGADDLDDAAISEAMAKQIAGKVKDSLGEPVQSTDRQTF